MAYYGLRKPFVASYNKEAGTYSNGFQCGKAIGVSITPNAVEGSLYADDEQDEYERAFTNANVTLNTNTLPIKAASTMYGHTINESTGEIIYKTTDESNYVGLGFVVAQTISGTKSFVATIITCVKFSESAEEFSTKGESITYVTPSQEGLAIADKNSQWKIKKTFTDSDDAIAFIKDYLNIEDVSA
ncbi:MAG: major tail protein [Butyrivibrio sp.]|nr:major tail protein [Butyrivibrio sp.]